MRERQEILCEFFTNFKEDIRQTSNNQLTILRGADDSIASSSADIRLRVSCWNSISEGILNAEN